MKVIELKKNKVALVDDEDFEQLNKMTWYITERSNTTYIRAIINGKYIYMHRYILNLKDRKITVDHIDHNGLNNQRSNLRPTQQSKNTLNKTSHKNSTSKYLGVHFNSRLNKWEAHIKNGNIKKYLGRFLEEKDAAIAYNNEARKLHKEYANLNIV